MDFNSANHAHKDSTQGQKASFLAKKQPFSSLKPCKAQKSLHLLLRHMRYPLMATHAPHLKHFNQDARFNQDAYESTHQESAFDIATYADIPSAARVKKPRHEECSMLQRQNAQQQPKRTSCATDAAKRASAQIRTSRPGKTLIGLYKMFHECFVFHFSEEKR